MTEPKTDSEFDYSSINVILAIGVMTLMAIIILFFFAATLALSQPKAGDLVSPKQEILHHTEDDTEDDTDELLMWEFFLNESVNNDW